jgi:hypothetical protein
MSQPTSHTVSIYLVLLKMKPSTLNNCIVALTALFLAAVFQDVLVPAFIPWRPTWMVWFDTLAYVMLLAVGFGFSVVIYSSEKFVAAVPTGFIRVITLLLATFVISTVIFAGVNSSLVMLSKFTASEEIETVEKVIAVYPNHKTGKRLCLNRALITFQSKEVDFCMDRIANSPLAAGDRLRIQSKSSFFGTHIDNVKKF